MKFLIASTAVVANAGASVDHVTSPASQMSESHLDREVEMLSSSVDDSYFTPRGFYGSSRPNDFLNEFERKEVDCASLKGNQTLPAECCDFAKISAESFSIANNSTAEVDECASLTGMARIQCYGLSFQPLDCSKFKGDMTMPFECSKQFGMVEEETLPETIILEEAV